LTFYFSYEDNNLQSTALAKIYPPNELIVHLAPRVYEFVPEQATFLANIVETATAHLSPKAFL